MVHEVSLFNWPVGCRVPRGKYRTVSLARKWLYTKPSTPQQLSYATYSGAGGLFLAVLFGAFSLRSENSIWKWLAGIFGIGGIVTSAVGYINQIVRPGTLPAVRLDKEIKIDRRNTEIKNCPSDVSVDLLRFCDDPSPLSSELFVYSNNGGRFLKLHPKSTSRKPFGEEVFIKSRSGLNRYNSKLLDSNQINSLRIEDLPHRCYKAVIENSGEVIDIFIPIIYEKARPSYVKEFLDALEISLNDIPIDILKLGLIKKIQLHVGEEYDRVGKREFEGADDSFKTHSYFSAGSNYINIFHGQFNGKLVNEEEKLTLERLIGFSRTTAVGKKSSPSSIHHEIGHILESYLISNSAKFHAPILRENDLTINRDFAGYDWNNDKDAWVHIVRMDKNRVSEDGSKYPTEDFAESVAGYILDEAYFKKSFPNRWGFLNEVFDVIAEKNRISRTA